MLKGLAITPPVIGRISIGRVVEKNGKRLPEKDDQFTITTQVQNRDGWLLHPYDSALRHGLNSDKLRMIPIRMPFNDPALNLRSEYCLFDRENGRPVCVGNGETCRRYAGDEMQSLPCPSPDTCQFANGQCKPYGRLNIKVGDDDDFGTFIFRTSGYNSIRCLTARLHYYQAASGGLLAYLPLQLQLRGKSTTQSHRRPIYFVDITARDGLSLMDALSQAKEIHQQRTEAGFNQEALDEAARAGFANGAFEESTEDLSAITEEFFVSPESGEDLPEQRPPNSDGAGEVESSSLRDKLARKTKP